MSVTPGMKRHIELAERNLRNASNNMVDSLRTLETAERGILLNTLGIGLTGAATIGSAINAITAWLAWEPTTLVVSGAASVVFGAITAIQYDSMPYKLKQRAELIKAYKMQLHTYERMLTKHLPTAWQDYEYASPTTAKFSLTLRKLIDSNFFQWFFQGEKYTFAASYA